jgi:NTE family protein
MDDENQKIGLALGGGAVLGASHIGTLKALEECDLAPDMIAGTSIGAFIAAFYAFGVSIEEMTEIAINMKWLNISSLSLSKRGLLSNEKLGVVLEERVGKRDIADADLPLAIVTTDLSSGEKVVFREGDLATAVMASTCIPGIFIPIESDGRILVDGVLVENVPVSPLEEMKADQIIAADVNALRLYDKPDDIIEVVMNALDIAVDSLSRPQTDDVDLLIRPKLTSYSRTEMDPEKIGGLIEEGYQTTMQKIEESELYK